MKFREYSLDINNLHILGPDDQVTSISELITVRMLLFRFRSIQRDGHKIVAIFTVLDKNGKQVEFMHSFNSNRLKEKQEKKLK